MPTGVASLAKVVDRRAQDETSIIFICDFTPPRGADLHLLNATRYLDADFVSVAYNPGKSTRINSIIAAHWIREHTGKDVLFTLATRDMNKVAVQSLLLGATLLGLENVVALKGDEFTESEQDLVKTVDDFKPTELLSSLLSMNEGLDFRGGKLQPPTDFCIGATIDLGHEIAREAKLAWRKTVAGARFFLLQAIFDPQKLNDFLETYSENHGERLSSPIFCGVQVMTSDSLVFSDVPDWVYEDLEKGRSGEDIAVQVIHQLVASGHKSIYLIPPILKSGRRDYQAAQRVLETFKA